jgi:hypothetical protein
VLLLIVEGSADGGGGAGFLTLKRLRRKSRKEDMGGVPVMRGLLVFEVLVDHRLLVAERCPELIG